MVAPNTGTNITTKDQGPCDASVCENLSFNDK